MRIDIASGRIEVSFLECGMMHSALDCWPVIIGKCYARVRSRFIHPGGDFPSRDDVEEGHLHLARKSPSSLVQDTPPKWVRLANHVFPA